MTRIRAFVVGVAKHAEPSYDLQGPEESAMRVADWLLGLADVQLELHLFLSKGAALTTAIAAAVAAGAADKRVIFYGTTGYGAVDAFARLGIGQGIRHGTRLFVYWSGHGETCSSTDDRIFMCGDYEDGLPNRVFNASAFLRRMRSIGYSFKDELMLADVCAPFKLPAPTPPEKLEKIDTPQVSCFASRAGTYAPTPEAGGKFTDTALQVLAAEKGYPADLECVAKRIAEALDMPDGPVVRLMTSNGHSVSEQLIGGQSVAGPAYLDSATDLLRRLDVADTEVRFHYERTAIAMKFATLPGGAKRRDVLSHLCDLYEDVDLMPFGLLQFMLRLSRVKDYGNEIANWLDAEAPGQQSARDTVHRLLIEERRHKVILFVVEEKDGALDSVRPCLCEIDGSLRVDHRFASVVTRCKDWAELVAVVQRTLDEFREGEDLPDLEVHFAVDVPLLDQPFHNIPLKEGGETIGALVPVFLRHRTRLLTYEPNRFNNWQAYAATLRTKGRGDLTWVRIEPKLPLPEEHGMCYAGFALPHPSANAASRAPQKRILDRLLKLGTSVLYVSHDTPPGVGWDTVGDWLGKLTAGLAQVDGFAKVFYDRRVRGSDLAVSASLLWDDPHCNPFPPSYGTSDNELKTS
jgi:hypothetical protein